MKNLIILISISLFLISCVKEDLLLSKIDYTDVAIGSISRALEVEQKKIIIREEAEWEELKLELGIGSNLGMENKFFELHIDFNKYIILAVIERSWGNATNVQINEINEYENKISIFYNIIHSDAPAVTQPFHIVKIPSTKKRILFN